MKSHNKLKILNDPIYGFITIPNELIFDIIEHPYFQRLRRITQMGVSYLVYPGAHHTRFHHALGCMHLMQKAINVLRFKNVQISSEEEQALLIAILLHDVGHGPFSHAMEHSIVNGVSHEAISLMYMKQLNKVFEGKLDLAIEIFQGNNNRKFLYQLISSQLDMDRLDYLKRDSFYTGVAEGNINSERLISMLNVVDDELVVEEKGIYSVEKFLIARRLMYWQVYLHKTSLVAEQIITRVLKRAKELTVNGEELEASASLKYFLKNPIDGNRFSEDVLERFSKLDDNDIISAIKAWTTHSDEILATLSNMILNRKLLKIKISNNKISDKKLETKKEKVIAKGLVKRDMIDYFVFKDEISNIAYHADKQNINILKKNGKKVDVAKASDQFNLEALTTKVVKYYICYPKES